MLAQGNDSLQVDMLLHSDTSLSLFRANFSLLLLLNAACLAEKQQIPILKSLVLTYDLPHSRQARQSLHYWSMRLISWVVLVWRSVLLVEKIGVPGEKHRPVVSHWQTLSHHVVLSTPCLSGFRTRNFSGDCIGSYKSNYHTIMTTTTSNSIK